MPIPSSWTPAGVDYGLKDQCIRTVAPSEANFYFDDVGCPSAGYPTTHYWTTAVETETLASTPNSCAGPTDQSALINGNSSPVSESWTGNDKTGYTVQLKTNYSHLSNLCAPNTFTWVPLMDNFVGGGPLPAPDHFVQQFAVQLSRDLPTASGATRAFAGFGGQWDVAGSGGASTLATFSIEVDFYTDPTWGKQSGTPADIIAYTKGGAFAYYAAVDGSKLDPKFDLALSTKSPETLTINWAAVIQHLIGEGLFPRPIDNWGRSNAVTSAGFVGTEIRNAKSGTGGPMIDLHVSKFEEGSF
jgi:hypothetical protein